MGQTFCGCLTAHYNGGFTTPYQMTTLTAQLEACKLELKAARDAALLEGVRAGKIEAQLLHTQEERKFDALIMELALQRMTSMVTTGKWIAPEVIMENLTARIASVRTVCPKDGTVNDTDEVHHAQTQSPPG